MDNSRDSWHLRHWCMTIFVTWLLRMTLDSISHSCDIFCHTHKTLFWVWVVFSKLLCKFINTLLSWEQWKSRSEGPSSFTGWWCWLWRPRSVESALTASSIQCCTILHGPPMPPALTVKRSCILYCTPRPCLLLLRYTASNPSQPQMQLHAASVPPVPSCSFRDHVM